MSEDKKIIIDEDWKSQVEAEKEAAKQTSPATAGPESPAAEPPAEAAGGDPTGDDPPMPPPSIGLLMSSLATEALIAMGQFPHPATGEATPRPNLAKYLIGTLEVLKEKTAGNLAAEESRALDDVLHQLRMAFIGAATPDPAADVPGPPPGDDPSPDAG